MPDEMHPSGYIMKAFMEAELRQTYDVAIELYKCCLDVLRSLRESWIAVPVVDKGVVFMESFIFGIQHLYIDAIMRVWRSLEFLHSLSCLHRRVSPMIRTRPRRSWRNSTSSPTCSSAKWTQRLATLVRSNRWRIPGRSAPSTRIPVERPTRECAHDSLCLCRTERRVQYEGILLRQKGNHQSERRQGALCIALKNMSPSQSFSLRETLAVMERLRVTAPKAKEIWEFSPLSAGGVWDTYKVIGRQEQKLRDRVTSGTLSLDAIYSN